MNWLRDVILIVVAIGLLVAVLWPQSSDGPADSHLADTAPIRDGSSDAEFPPVLPPGETSLQPLTNVATPLFPLVKGARWLYLVSDSSGLAPVAQWTLKIILVKEKQ